MRISDWSSDVCSSDLAFGMAQAIDRAASATFRNGVRPSGILSTKDSLTADQRGVAENMMKEKFAGSLHAGRPMLLDCDMQWTQLTMNPAIGREACWARVCQSG